VRPKTRTLPGAPFPDTSRLTTVGLGEPSDGTETVVQASADPAVVPQTVLSIEVIWLGADWRPGSRR
jgi:hypothetical protein